MLCETAHLRRARSTLLSGHDENERRRNDARWAVSTPNSATATTRLHTIEGSPTNSFSQFTGDVSALQTPASPLEGAEKAEEQLLQEQLQLTSRRMQELETEVEQGSRALDVANVKLAEQLLLCSTLSARLLWPDEAANDALDALEEDTACTNDPFDGLRGRSPAAEVLSDDPIESLSATSEEFSEMEKKEISAIMPFAISPREDIEAAFNSLQSLGKDSMALGSAGVEEYRGDLEPKRLEEQQKMSAYVTYLAHTLGTPGNQSPTSAGTPRDSRVSPRISLMTPRSRMQGIKRIIRSRDEARALLCWVQHLSSVRADRIRSCQEPCSTSKVEGGGREKHHTDEPQLKEAQVTDVRTLHLSKICSRMTHHIFQQRQKRSKQRVFSVWHTLARDRLWCSKIAKGRIEDVHIKLKSLVLKEWSETCKWRVASRRSQAKLENTSERNNLRNLLQLWGGHSIFQAGKQQLVSALKKRTVLRKTSATLIAWAAATSCQQLSVQECDWDCGFTGPPEDVAAHEKTCEAMLLSTAWKRETELSLRPRVDDDAPKDADRERLMLWLPTDTVIVHASKNLNAWCATGALRRYVSPGFAYRFSVDNACAANGDSIVLNVVCLLSRWLPKDSLPRTLSDECAASESSGSVISDKWFQGGRSNSTRVLARLLRLVRDEDDELGAVIASSVANSSSQVAADQVAAALVRTTAQAMSRCLIGDAEAVVLNFLQLLEGTVAHISLTRNSPDCR